MSVNKKPLTRKNIIALRDIVILPGTIISLLIGREKSLNALELQDKSKKDHSMLFLLQKDANIEDPSVKDLEEAGVLADILQVLTMPDNTVKILLEVRSRVLVSDVKEEGCFSANYSVVSDKVNATQAKAYFNELKLTFKHYIKIRKKEHQALLTLLKGVKDFSLYLDIVVQSLSFTLAEKHQFLHDFDLISRAKTAIKLLIQETERLEIEKSLQNAIKKDIELDQAAYIKEKRLKAVKKLLGDDVLAQSSSIEDGLQAKIKSLPLDSEVKKRLLSDCEKLKMMPAASAEATVIKNHLEWIVDVPWKKNLELI